MHPTTGSISMTSGTSMRWRQRCLPALCLVAAAFWASLPAADADDIQSSPWTLDSLMASLAHTEHRTARFTERRYLSALDQPLDLSGTLAFTPPDRLEKTTLSPSRERLLVERERLTIERDAEQGGASTSSLAQRQTLDLSEHPEVEALVESVRATLAGDGATLSRLFDVSVEGDSAGWSVGLVPWSEQIQKVVRTIRIEGSGGTIQSIAIEQADGDRAVMTVVQDGP